MNFSVVFIILIPISLFYVALCWPQKKEKVKPEQRVIKTVPKANTKPSEAPNTKKDDDINLF